MPKNAADTEGVGHCFVQNLKKITNLPKINTSKQTRFQPIFFT